MLHKGCFNHSLRDAGNMFLNVDPQLVDSGPYVSLPTFTCQEVHTVTRFAVREGSEVVAETFARKANCVGLNGKGTNIAIPTFMMSNRERTSVGCRRGSLGFNEDVSERSGLAKTNSRHR